MRQRGRPFILDPKADREGRIVVEQDSVVAGVALICGGLAFGGLGLAMLVEQLLYPWPGAKPHGWLAMIPCFMAGFGLLATLLGARVLFLKTVVTIDRQRGTVGWRRTRLFRTESWQFPLAGVWLLRR